MRTDACMVSLQLSLTHTQTNTHTPTARVKGASRWHQDCPAYLMSLQISDTKNTLVNISCSRTCKYLWAVHRAEGNSLPYTMTLEECTPVYKSSWL